MVYVCPYCGREYTKRSYFAKHMREKHGVEKPFESISTGSQPEPFVINPEPEKPAAKKVPVVEKEKKERREKRMEEGKYECGNCGHKFSKRYKHCPNCGARFDWSAIEEE